MSNELSVIPSLAPSTMEQALAFANQMAQARLLPAHLQKSPSDCLRVVLQAVRWQMDPFAVADKTSIIQNKLMYEGQLVSAVVNARGNLAKRLDYSYKGDGDARVLTVTGTIRGETEPRAIDLPFSLAKKINKNGQMQINPDQQAAYIGARIWARRHMPELMLGVYAPDEIDETEVGEPRDVTGTGEQQKRADAPPRKKKGANTVVEATVEPVPAALSTPPPTEVAAEKPATVSSPAPAEEIPAGAHGDAAEADAATPKGNVLAPQPRAFLTDKEELPASITIKDITCISFATTPNPTLGLKAKVTGDFNGEVCFLGGAKWKDGSTTEGEAIAPWVVGASLRVKLRGSRMKSGVVRVWVDSVVTDAAVQPEEF